MVEGSGPIGLRRDPTAQTLREIPAFAGPTRRRSSTFPDHHSGNRGSGPFSETVGPVTGEAVAGATGRPPCRASLEPRPADPWQDRKAMTAPTKPPHTV